jgi:ectoine hydroxylase-related dioxygenase (phytanoyl-CoA dioxygenase family)
MGYLSVVGRSIPTPFADLVQTRPVLASTTSVHEVLGALERDGCATVEAVLSPDSVTGIKEELEQVLARTPSGRNLFEGTRTRRIYAIFAKTRSLDAAAVHPLVMEVLDEVLGHYQLSGPTGIEIGPGEVAQVLHYDDAIYPMPRPHPEIVLNTMWALDDFTEANGATRFIRGSHRWRDERPAPDAETEVAEMPSGSVLFYLGSLWHGGGANVTDEPRLGVVLEYAASWVRQQENHVLAVPADVVRELPQRLQELLGYNVRPPFTGYVDGRHPRRLLEIPNA